MSWKQIEIMPLEPKIWKHQLNGNILGNKLSFYLYQTGVPLYFHYSRWNLHERKVGLGILFGRVKKSHLHELMEVSIIKLCLSFNGNQKLALSAYSEFIQFELCSKFDVSLATRCVLDNSNYIVTSFGNNYSFNQTNYHHHHFCCWNCVCRLLSSTCISRVFQARIRI